MKQLIIIITIILNFSLFGQSSNFFFWDDTTGTTYNGELKVPLYAIDLDGSTEYGSNSAPSLMLEGTYSLNETFSDGDYTTGNVWTVSTGAYAVTDSISMYSGLTYALRCATAGIIYIPCNQSYGYWAWDWRKYDNSTSVVYFINSTTTNFTGISKGYMCYHNVNENTELDRNNGSSSLNTLLYSPNLYISNIVAYRDSLVRNTNGSFSLYIKGGSFGDTYTLVSTTGGGGTNPVTDNTYTRSNYFVLDLDAGDAIANIQCQYGSGSLDLNGHEMVKYPYKNSSFENGDTTFWANNGTHSIDTTSAQKQSGSYGAKVIGTGVGDSSTNFCSLAYTNFNNIVAGNKYTIEAWKFDEFLNSDTTFYKLGSVTGYVVNTVASTWQRALRKTFLATTAEVNATLKIWNNRADTTYWDNFSITQRFDRLKSIWFKTSNTGANKYLIGRYASSKGLQLSINTSNQLVAQIGDGTTTATITGSTNVCDGGWHNAVVTTNGTGNMTMYLDGDTEGSATSITGLGSIIHTAALNIGFSSENYFNGYIGETELVRFPDISTNNHTPEEIYLRGLNRVHMPSSYTGGTIVGWWKWSGNTNALMLDDASSSANDLVGTNLTTADQVILNNGYRP